MKKTLLIICLFGLSISAFPQLKLPSVFADRMVLQQKEKVLLWGKAKPGSVVHIFTDWDSEEYSIIVDKDSLWSVKVKTIEASYNSYKIIFKNEGETCQINDVLLGEVWFCGGQSNMEQPLKGYHNQPILESISDIVSSTNNYFRCYTVKKNKSTVLLDDVEGNWLIASPNTSGEFTATGYYFGRMIQQILNVPLGLLHCSYGGSTIQAWMPDAVLDKFPSINRDIGDIEDRRAHLKSSVLYKGMLNSIFGYGVKGAIWYQGEANLEEYKSYADWFAALHDDWIVRWGNGKFPVYFCQIAPYPYNEKQKDKAVLFREVQMKIAEERRESTGIAILMDAGEENCIHPANKKVAGERLAYIAMAKTYGFKDISYMSPSYKSMEVKNNNKVWVYFNDAPLGLTFKGLDTSGFELAGEDRIFYPAKARIIREGIELSSPEVVAPVAVRYAFKNYYEGTLFGVNGLPVSSFRSDNWD